MQIERVVLLPRRMVGRNVEAFEIIVVGFDVRPFGDGKAHVGKDLGDLVENLADRVNASFRQRPEPHRQRDVRALGCKPVGKFGAFELAAT